MRAKRLGFSDAQLGWLWSVEETDVRSARLAAGVRATMKTVDTCAAEFEAHTPYHYSTYEDDDEVTPSDRPKIIIIGSGPNRIGQGVEFDYCCVQASFALHDAGYETVMINCNPETVSTDYDTSDRLYFEPVTWEDVSNVIDVESATGDVAGVIVSLGGQTPLKLAGLLPASASCSVPLRSRSTWPRTASGGTPCAPVWRSPSRRGAPRPPSRRPGPSSAGSGTRHWSGLAMSSGAGPWRSSTATRTCVGPWTRWPASARWAGRAVCQASAGRPVLVDRFLEDAIEVDVDAVRDGAGEILIGAVMEHVEEAGVHSGDSACVIPPPTLEAATIRVIEGYTRDIAAALEVVGPINVQFAVKHLGGPGGGGTQVFVIEANPRASRTVPFVSKATGVPLAKVGARVMAGATLHSLREEGLLHPAVTGGHVSVKEAVLPFARFPDADTLLGPEMRSTGEVMGIDSSFGLAFAKSQAAAGDALPAGGTVFFSLADRDKTAGVAVARRFVQLGFRLAATSGTAAYFESDGVPVETVVAKVSAAGETSDPREVAGIDAVALIRDGKVDLVVNTPRGRGPRADGAYIRRAANQHRVACLTTVAAARAAAAGIADRAASPLRVRSLQEYHESEQLPLS